jgi:hypothetical protein
MTSIVKRMQQLLATPSEGAINSRVHQLIAQATDKRLISNMPSAWAPWF